MPIRHVTTSCGFNVTFEIMQKLSRLQDKEKTHLEGAKPKA